MNTTALLCFVLASTQLILGNQYREDVWVRRLYAVMSAVWTLIGILSILQ